MDSFGNEEEDFLIGLTRVPAQIHRYCPSLLQMTFLFQSLSRGTFSLFLSFVILVV